jgi:hypothetical protein
MNTDEGEIPFGGRQHARQREKHLVIIGVYPRSSAPDSLAIPFRFSSFVNSYDFLCVLCAFAVTSFLGLLTASRSSSP